MTRRSVQSRNREGTVWKKFFQVSLFLDAYTVCREALLKLKLGFNDPHWDSSSSLALSSSLSFSPFTHVHSKESESSDRSSPVEDPWPRFRVSPRCNGLGQQEQDKTFESTLAETLWSGNEWTVLLLREETLSGIQKRKCECKVTGTQELYKYSCSSSLCVEVCYSQPRGRIRFHLCPDECCSASPSVTR